MRHARLRLSPAPSAVRWSAIPLAIVLALPAGAGSVEAQVRVAVVPFDGQGGHGARRQVQSALEDDSRVTPVDLDRVDSAASRAGARSGDSEGIAQLAGDLSVQLVIQGRVTGRGRRRRVRLVARDAQGAQLATAGGAMRGGGLSRAVESLLDEALPQIRSGTASVASTTPVARPRARPIDDEAPDDDRDDESRDGAGNARNGAVREWQMRAPILSLQIGVVPRSREADITFEDTRHGRYSAWYPELGVRAEVRPLARDPSLARALYGRFAFAHAVGLASRIDATGQPVDNAFYRLDFAIGGLFPLADVFDLGVELGFGWDTYNLADNPLLESAEYAYVRPALRAHARLAQEILVLSAEIGVRPAFSRGDLHAYGPGGDTLGFDVGGKLGGSYAVAGDVGLSWALEMAWVGYWMNFSEGMGMNAARSGTESSLRIGIWAGVAVW
jgi:hypothetical protein